MKIFEGYKKAVEIYNNYTNTQDGREYVTKLNTMGVSKEYMEWVTSNTIVYKIPLYLVLNAFRDWKKYVVKYYNDNNIQIPNINQLSYNQVIKTTNECKRKYAKPNPIYDKDGIYVGVLSTFQMANMLPINSNWCITKTPKRYTEFNNDNQKCLYIINSKNADPYRRVIAVCSMNNVEYWDSTNHRMEEEEVMSYEKTLPIEVENIIHRFAYQIQNNQELNTEQYMNKKLIRLTESDLHKIVKESVNKILNEGFGDGMIERALNKKLKKLEANLTIGNLFDGLYHCQPTKCYATFESEDPNECGFVFKFYGGQYGYITLGGVYGFSSDHLSAAEYNAFLKGAEKLIPIIKKTIDEC